MTLVHAGRAPNRVMRRGTNRAVLVTLALTGFSAVLAGCARGDADRPTAVTLRATTTVPISVSTSTTVPNTTTTTVAATTTSSSIAATVAPEPPPPSEPPALAQLILRSDGIGAELFGADPDAVVNDVTALLGGNTDDTGWVESATLGACPGTRVRRVEWGTLKLWFADTSDFDVDRDHFFAWEYGQVSELGGDPAGLHTPGGVTLGSHVSDFVAEFPNAVVRPADEEFDTPATAFVSATSYAWLTGANLNDSVLVMFGGRPCGNS